MAGAHPVDRERRWALALAVAVAAVWGLSFVATRAAVAEIAPFTLAFLRFAIAMVLLGPLGRRALAGRTLARRDHVDLLLLGLVGVTAAVGLENLGLEHTTAAHGALIVSLAPIASALTDAIRDRRRPPARSVAGLVVALAGVGLIVGRDTGGGVATVLGDVLILVTVPLWVAYGILVSRLAPRVPLTAVTSVSLGWGCVMLAPLALAEAFRGPIRMPSVAALAALVGLGVFCSALAYLWWNRALSVLGVATTNAFIYAIPLFAVVGGIVLLGEPLTFEVAAGGTLVIAGLLLVARRGP